MEIWWPDKITFIPHIISLTVCYEKTIFKGHIPRIPRKMKAELLEKALNRPSFLWFQNIALHLLLCPPMLLCPPAVIQTIQISSGAMSGSADIMRATVPESVLLLIKIYCKCCIIKGGCKADNLFHCTASGQRGNKTPGGRNTCTHTHTPIKLNL